MESALVGTSTSLGLRAGGIASLSVLNGPSLWRMSPFWGCVGTRLLSAQEPARQRARESLSMTSIKRQMNRGFQGCSFGARYQHFPWCLLVMPVSGLGLLRPWGSLINHGFRSFLLFLSSNYSYPHLLSCVNCRDSQTLCKGNCLPSFFFTPISLKQRNTEFIRVLLTSYLAPFFTIFQFISLLSFSLYFLLAISADFL